MGLVTRLAKLEKEAEELKAERECRKSGRWKRSEHGSEHGRGDRENLNEFARLSESANGEFEAEGEEVVLIRRRQVLLDQLDEARWIKKNIEKRSRKVEQGVNHWLGPACLARYHSCIAEKERLARERREVKDKLRLGLRQLEELQMER